jgi:hypothetical protein
VHREASPLEDLLRLEFHKCQIQALSQLARRANSEEYFLLKEFSKKINAKASIRNAKLICRRQDSTSCTACRLKIDLAKRIEAKLTNPRKALPSLFDFVEAVECRDSVALGIGGIIEDLIDEIVNPCMEGNRYLSNVDQFSSRPANDVNP